ncbi:ligase-associated DNA damage response DEXH box helicase [Anatilimnocola sp. NA78]|uniref:ligase-associated DNA damage response DEXH box helicase n=1 Tax=Anatilimnocola sp. NA78 TaxID=3415683 RepID=UPI003CE594F5
MTQYAAEQSDLPQAKQQKKRSALQTINAWFEQQGWKPFPFQREVWNAYASGASGLVHATTGTGKTYAVWLAALQEWLTEQAAAKRPSVPSAKQAHAPLRVLWITPLRALVQDTAAALQRPLQDLQIPWTLETRTGDTTASQRAKQLKRLPTTLLTTPESLSMLLSRPDTQEQLRDLRLVVVDEWHELLASKRGVQTELALARLRRWQPQLKVWGLSATLGNLPGALDVLVGDRSSLPVPPLLVAGRQRKKIVIDSIIPANIERFPWAGHLGLRLLREVVVALEQAATSLVFTNTRSQSELWYQAILRAKPEWAGQLALHHGSISQASRHWVEDRLRAGKLKCVVCTSSLDLGVDFSAVERVIQVGSPKGVARLLQRAGRSGHEPGGISHVTCVPTNAIELIETVAAREAIAAGHLEAREPPRKPLDVLAQHAVTIAIGGGFTREDLLAEVRRTASYAQLTDEEWDWVLDFITRGGPALRAYPDYQKVIEREGRYLVENPRIIRQHRLSIGTIASDAALSVQYVNGPKLGTIEESFVSKMAPGERFTFGGRTVTLAYVRDMKVWVRKATGSDTGQIPRWMGGRMPLSTELATAVRRKLDEAARDELIGPEMQALRPLLKTQQSWSQIPRHDELLIEQVRSREGFHLFFYPFAGRLVHEGLAALFAWRLAQFGPITFSMAMNDYGLELVSPTPPPLEAALAAGLFSQEELQADIGRSLNAVEMARRQFREIARVAGLIVMGFPGQPRSARQMQASSGLLFDVFAEHDPANLLLRQAREEVLERQLDHTRLVETLRTLRSARIVIRNCERFTPLSFSLMVDRLRERLSTEKLIDRVRRMQQSLENAADKTARSEA